MAVQNAHRRFALAAAAPAFENLAVMAVMATSALLFGIGTPLDQITTPQLLLLGLGTTVAAALQAGVQWWGAYRASVPLLPIAGWADPEVRRLLRLALPSSGYAALNAANYLGLLVAAGGIPGGAVAFQIGVNFFSLPVAIGAKPLAIAQLPRLARSFNQQAFQAFQATYRSSLELTMFIALPAAVLFVGIPDVLAKAISFGDMATAAGIGLVVASIASLGPGIVGDAAFVVSTSASYARRDAASPLAAMDIRSAITFMGVALAVVVMRDLAVLWTLGIGFSAANLLAAAYLHGRQTRALPSIPEVTPRHWIGDLAAALVALIPSLLVAHWLEGATLGGVGPVLVAGAAIAASGIAYLAVQWVRGSDALTTLVAGIGKPTSPHP
jgi:putative peptidoglycan lipid II flippase